MNIRNYLPQTLMSRSLLILVLPVVLAQIFAVTVFWDNHWDKMTRRLAFGVAGEIAITADRIENNYSEELFWTLSDYLSRHLNLYIEFELGRNLPETVPEYSLYEGLMISPLLEALKQKTPYDYVVTINRADEKVVVYTALKNGLLSFSLPQSRLFSSSGYVFIILLVGSSFTLLIISIIFLRNQIRPIRRLAAAASMMGKGRTASLGKIRGAKEVRQAGEAFETMQRRIRRQIEQRTAMLAGVSHDLRTPLTRVKLGLSMLDDQSESDAMLKDLDEMESMMNAYLEFARGERVEDVIELDLVAFIKEIASVYANEHQSVTVNTTQDTINMFLQRINFRRAIENILSNAIRYGDIINITLDVNADRVMLMIEDNGCGITEDKYDEAFKPFVRLDPSRSKETGGAGLGLSVAMDVVMSHGGKITLGRSETLGGLMVKIRLPR